METGFESLENIHQSMFWQKLIFARLFRTNLISQIILNNKNIYLNSENPHFYKKFFFLYVLHKTNGHSIFFALGMLHLYPYDVPNIKSLFDSSILAFKVLAINAK